MLCELISWLNREYLPTYLLVDIISGINILTKQTYKCRGIHRQFTGKKDCELHICNDIYSYHLSCYSF